MKSHEHSRDLIAEIRSIAVGAHVDRNEREQVFFESFATLVEQTLEGSTRYRHDHVRDADPTSLCRALHVDEGTLVRR